MIETVALAERAAREAGALIVSLLGNARVENKGLSHDLVTEADRRAEALIVEVLEKDAPDCAVLGEEGSRHTSLKSDRLWIIDPLDGTTNFAHGIPHFGVSIAYAEKGIVRAGVVFDPMRNELFSARLNGGASLNGLPIRVSKSAVLSKSLIGTGFYYDRGEKMRKTLRGLHALFNEKIHCIRRMGAATLDLTWVACGRYDAYFEYTLSPWDFAAGLLILGEAGGIASDPEGKPADLFSKGLICSNGLIHDELLKCVLDPALF